MIHLISFEKKFIKAILRWLFPSKCQTGRYVLSKKTFNILAVKWHNADVFSSSFSKDCREAGKGWGGDYQAARDIDPLSLAILM